jgi:ubiquinone/menaquinone biosynthesis C-methylase UbiE
MWSLGDYARVATLLEPAALALAEAVAIRPGMRVLDVGAGNGNFALEAARRGAEVVASDLTPQMLELGRRRSEAEGHAVEWIEADAEALPFPDHDFDLVASVFGAQFGPRAELVAEELFRVVKPDGLVAIAAYGHGFLSRYTDLLRELSRPAPVTLPSPFAWGDPEEARRRFAPHASSVEVHERELVMKFGSVDAFLDFWTETNPPTIALQKMAPPEVYAQLLTRARSLVEESNLSADGVTLGNAYVMALAKPRRSPSAPRG